MGKGKNSAGNDNSASVTSCICQLYRTPWQYCSADCLALSVLSIYGISRLEVENRFIDYFRSDTEIYQGMEIIDASSGRHYALDIILQAPTFAEPEQRLLSV